MMLITVSGDSGRAIIAGVAAVIVAVIAARTADRRQREALSHDRELTDLKDLRILLDKAAMAFERSHYKFGKFLDHFYEHGRDLPDEPREKLARAGRVMLALSSRLNVLLDESGPIASPFRRAGDEMLRTVGRVHPDELEGVSDDVIDEMLDEMELSLVVFEEAWAEFTAAALERIGAIDTRDSGAHRSRT